MSDMITPTEVRIESSSNCQLRCPSCPTASGEVRGQIRASHLKAIDFQQFVDDNPFVCDIEISNFGELFLNPELEEIIHIARSRDVVLHADNGSNFNFVSEGVLEAMVQGGFRSITCSIDGTTQETYSKYRIRGDVNQVFENICRLNRHRKSAQSAYPRLMWQFVVFEHNVHELADARRLAAEFGMGFYPKISWDESLAPRTPDLLVQIAPDLPAINRTEYRKKFGRDYTGHLCLQLWRQPAYNSDGTNLGCCRNYWGNFGGNLFKEGYLPTVNSEVMQYARQMLRGVEPRREDVPCSQCVQYNRMASSSSWVQEEDVIAATQAPRCEITFVIDRVSPKAKMRCRLQRIPSNNESLLSGLSANEPVLDRVVEANDSVVLFEGLSPAVYKVVLEATQQENENEFLYSREVDLTNKPIIRQVRIPG